VTPRRRPVDQILWSSTVLAAEHDDSELVGGYCGYNYDSISIRLQIQRATTIRRPTRRP